MGLFDGRSYSDSERLRPHSTHHTPRSRGASPARSTKSQGFYVRPSAHRSTSGSFFGGSGTGNHGYSSQSRGVFSSFNAFGGRSSSSYYGRRPRDGYISYLVHKLQRMIKELWYYARRHPVKAFFAVIVPLLSAGGAIHGLMRQFGVRIPGLDGRTSYSRGSGAYYGSSGYGSGRTGGGGGLMENAGSLMQIARAFM